METQKVVVDIPKNLIEMIDSLNKHQKTSRSKFISEAVREKILKEKELSLKESYDAVFSDESVRKEQLETAAWFENRGNDEGQEW